MFFSLKFNAITLYIYMYIYSIILAKLRASKFGSKLSIYSYKHNRFRYFSIPLIFKGNFNIFLQFCFLYFNSITSKFTNLFTFLNVSCSLPWNAPIMQHSFVKQLEFT